MLELMYEAKKFMNGEEAIDAKYEDLTIKKRKETDDR